MPNKKYYPALSDKIDVGTLPDFLSFIKDVFDDIYYKNYYESRNATGSKVFYSLDIVPRTRLEQKIFGTEMTLVLNPDYEDNTISSFPITIFWQWEILQFIRNFKSSSFSFTPEAMFDLTMAMLQITKEQILIIATDAFVYPKENTAFEQLQIEINTLYDSAIVIDENDEDCYTQLVNEIESLNENVFLTIFSLYLLNDTIEETIETLRIFFYEFFERDLDEYIKDITTPKITATLHNLTLALEFPRKWLIPIDPQTNLPIEDKNEKSKLTFTAGSVRFSTENGLEFEEESNISFQKSQIGKTGITLFFERMRLDLSRTKNITEATAAGYPDNFMGVFVESAEIGLPEKWFNSVNDNTTIGIFGENLLIGTGGISGTFGLRAIDSSGKPIGNAPNGAEMFYRLGGSSGFIIGFKQFDFSLQMGNFQDTNIQGSLQIPGFKDVNGDTAKIDISMSFGNEGDFYITAADDTGISIHITDKLTVIDTKNILITN